MTSVKLSIRGSADTITVDCSFIDHFMPMANGEFVKVYLYLLRVAMLKSSPTIVDMADALNCTESDILRALNYWEKQGLICLEYSEAGELMNIDFLSPNDVSGTDYDTYTASSINSSIISRNNTRSNLNLVSDNTGLTKDATNINAGTNHVTDTLSVNRGNAGIINDANQVGELVNMPPVESSYDPEAIDEYFGENAKASADFDNLMYELEMFTGNTISSTVQSSIFYLHKDLGLPFDLICYTVEQCAEKGIKNFEYIKKVAIGWYEKSIFTVADAKAYNDNHSEASRAVKKALGLTTWGDEASQLLNTWLNEYHMPVELITEACTRAYLRTGGSGALSYAKSILSSWNESGIKDMLSLKEMDEKRKESFRKSGTKSGNANGGNTSKAYQAFHNFQQGEGMDYDALMPKKGTLMKSKKEN